MEIPDLKTPGNPTKDLMAFWTSKEVEEGEPLSRQELAFLSVAFMVQYFFTMLNKDQLESVRKLYTEGEK